MEKIWGLMFGISDNMWVPLHTKREFEVGDWVENYRADKIAFDWDVFQRVIEKAAKAGINTILLDVGDGVRFESHPEIVLSDSLTRKEVKELVDRCRTLNIDIIPKLNFSTGHSYWTKDWRARTSSPEYYTFVQDLLTELYEMFEQPKYIHIGMDEENQKNMQETDLVIFRRRDLLWHDIRFMIKTIKDLGAIPVMWHDPIFSDEQEFEKNIKPEDVVIMPWRYVSLKEKYFTKPTRGEDKPHWFNDFVDELERLGLTYLEERPREQEVNAQFHNILIPLMNKGYKMLPCGSNCNYSEINHIQLMEYFEENASEGNAPIGYFTAPWKSLNKNNLAAFERGIDMLIEARKINFGE